jgi:hypothetical protein
MQHLLGTKNSVSTGFVFHQPGRHGMGISVLRALLVPAHVVLPVNPEGNTGLCASPQRRKQPGIVAWCQPSLLG